MNPKRILTKAEIAAALEMRGQGIGTERIARHLKCGRNLLYETLKQSGVKPKRQEARDPVSSYPIGQVPKGHPLYEADQEMLRARKDRPRVEGVWGNSSMAWDWD